MALGTRTDKTLSALAQPSPPSVHRRKRRRLGEGVAELIASGKPLSLSSTAIRRLVQTTNR
jgi:hypothetical protein